MFYGYTRVSTGEQAEGYSLEIQERRIVGLAAANGDIVARVFSDADVSGSVPLRDRPAGRVLWATLQRGDTLIASKLDRLFRSASDALETADALKKQGVNLVLLDIGMEPVNQTGAAKMFFSLMAVVAEFERTIIRERVRGGMEAKRAAGGHIGGYAPFGYRVDGHGRTATLVPDPELAPAVAKISELRTAGMSYRRITYALEKEMGVRLSWKAVRNTLARLAAANAPAMQSGRPG